MIMPEVKWSPCGGGSGWHFFSSAPYGVPSCDATADRLTPLGKRPIIASLSLGATRTFRLKRAAAGDAGEGSSVGGAGTSGVHPHMEDEHSLSVKYLMVLEVVEALCSTNAGVPDIYQALVPEEALGPQVFHLVHGRQAFSICQVSDDIGARCKHFTSPMLELRRSINSQFLRVRWGLRFAYQTVLPTPCNQHIFLASLLLQSSASCSLSYPCQM